MLLQEPLQNTLKLLLASEIFRAHGQQPTAGIQPAWAPRLLALGLGHRALQIVLKGSGSHEEHKYQAELPVLLHYISSETQSCSFSSTL